MDRVYEYTPLKLELLETLELETLNLEASAEDFKTRFQGVNSDIDQLDEDIDVLRGKLENISQAVNDTQYQAQVAADTLQVKLRKSILAVVDEEDHTKPDLSNDYAELLDPTSEYYGFSEGSAWFILES